MPLTRLDRTLYRSLLPLAAKLDNHVILRVSKVVYGTYNERTIHSFRRTKNSRLFQRLYHRIIHEHSKEQ